jgi:alpha-1,2-mannosyltransferase
MGSNANRRGRNTRRTALALILLALSVARIATYWTYAHTPYRISNDFTPDYVSAREWTAGRDPYAPLSGLYDEYFGLENVRLVVEPDQLNPHPPILIVLAAPFARLGLGPARVLLGMLTLAAIFLGVFLLCRRLEMRRDPSVVVAAAVLALPLVTYEVRWAQMNGFLLLALVLGWRSLRAGSDRGAGLALGFAAALKIYPWLMVVPLIRERRFRAVAWMVGTAAAATAAGAVALGPAATVRFATVASARNVDAWGAAPNGISLVTLPFRLAASGRWLHPGAPVAGWISFAGLVILGLCFLGAARTPASASGDLMWATVPWMILGSPIAWPHYLVTAIPLGILVLARSGRFRPPARAAAALAVGVLVAASPFGEWLPHLSYGAAMAASSVVIVALGSLAALDFSSSTAPPPFGARTEPPSSAGRAPRQPSSNPAPPR